MGQKPIILTKNDPASIVKNKFPRKRFILIIITYIKLDNTYLHTRPLSPVIVCHVTIVFPFTIMFYPFVMINKHVTLLISKLFI